MATSAIQAMATATPNARGYTFIRHALSIARGYRSGSHLWQPSDVQKVVQESMVGLMAVEGYDNVKKKFLASWIDNMGTGIMNLEGTYDAATKSLTYHAEYEPMPDPDATQ